jgi:hypothetical protein
MASSSWPPAEKSCACAYIAFLAGIFSLYAESISSCCTLILVSSASCAFRAQNWFNVARDDVLLLRMITPLAVRLDRGNKYSGSDFDLKI